MLLKIRAWHGKEPPDLSDLVHWFHPAVLHVTQFLLDRLHMKFIQFEVGFFPSAVLLEMFRYNFFLM